MMRDQSVKMSWRATIAATQNWKTGTMESEDDDSFVQP